MVAYEEIDQEANTQISSTNRRNGSRPRIISYLDELGGGRKGNRLSWTSHQREDEMVHGVNEIDLGYHLTWCLTG
jgi:hypothetical protein